MSDAPPRVRRRRIDDRMPEPDDIVRRIEDIRPPATARAKTIERRLEELIASFALGFAMMGDDYCANVVAHGAPHLAQAWANLAKESPAVRAVIERLLRGGAWGGVVISTLAIALPIAQHHNIYPQRMPNPFLFMNPIPAPWMADPTQNGHSHATEPDRAST